VDRSSRVVTSLGEVYFGSLGYWLERQYHFIDVLGDESTFVCEPRAGRIRFGRPGRDELVVRAQVLATVAGGEWLWAWANDKAGLPPEVVTASRRVRALGAERSISGLDLPVLYTDDFWTEEKFVVVACGLLDGQATFRWCWGEGTMFFVIDDPDFPADERPARMRMHSTLLDLHQAAMNVGVDFGEVLRPYLARSKVAAQEQGNGSIRVYFPTGEGLLIRHDAQTDELRIGFFDAN
jgi:hypothetical protein